MGEQALAAAAEFLATRADTEPGHEGAAAACYSGCCWKGLKKSGCVMLVVVKRGPAALAGPGPPDRRRTCAFRTGIMAGSGHRRGPGDPEPAPRDPASPPSRPVRPAGPPERAATGVEPRTRRNTRAASIAEALACGCLGTTEAPSSLGLPGTHFTCRDAWSRGGAGTDREQAGVA